jgi:hypothetical protein
MSKKPSQDSLSRGLAVSTAGTACVRANGGDAPVPQRREPLGDEGSSETLPIEEGWGSKMFRWFRELEADATVQKAVEWVLVIVLGFVFWLLIAATTVV